MSTHKDFYSYAKYYDIAFDFKNVSAECDFLSGCFEKRNGRPAKSFLELAAGPGLHAIEFAKRGLHSCALDLSPDMVKYGAEKASHSGVQVNYHCGDMVEFDLGEKFDVITILMDSASYLLDNEQTLCHFQSVSRHLNPGGVYVLEIGHPRDVFDIGEPSNDDDWKVQKDGVEVHVQWGADTDEFDPITQVVQTTAKISVNDNGSKHELVEIAPQRCFTANEFMALTMASPHLKQVEVFGALHPGIPFDNRRQAIRMVPVLQKNED